MTMPTEAELRALALEQQCPVCDAKPGHQCGRLSKRDDMPGYPPARLHWTTQKYPHAERVTLAWRALRKQESS